MSTDRDTTRIVRSWLDEGVTRLPDRVLDAVLDQIPATPQRRATWWPARRPSTMNIMLKFGLAAAVVAVAILIGLNYLGGTNIGGPEDGATPTPEPTATPAPSATPQPSASPESADLPVGSSFVLWNAAPVGAMTVTIPAAGWSGELQGGILIKNNSGADPPDGAGMIVLADPIDWLVPSDPCAWSSSLPDTPATTVDELIAALSAQESRDPSEAADVTVGGFTGMSITLHVPDDADFGGCDQGVFCTIARESVAREGGCQRFHQGPGQIDKLWIVDVNGTPLIIDAAWYDETPPDHVAEIEAIVASATVGE